MAPPGGTPATSHTPPPARPVTRDPRPALAPQPPPEGGPLQPRGPTQLAQVHAHPPELVRPRPQPRQGRPAPRPPQHPPRPRHGAERDAKGAGSGERGAPAPGAVPASAPEPLCGGGRGAACPPPLAEGRVRGARPRVAAPRGMVPSKLPRAGRWRCASPTPWRQVRGTGGGDGQPQPRLLQRRCPGPAH